MHRTAPHSSPTRLSRWKLSVGLLVLAIPIGLMLATILRAAGAPSPILVGGIASAGFFAIGLLRQFIQQRRILNFAVIPLYLFTGIILWGSADNYLDWFLQVSVAVLLAVPFLMFAFQEFLPALGYGRGRAAMLVNRLAERTDWPDDLAVCKLLPEVKALRAALWDDVEPALDLLMHPKPQVRIAALAAMEFRSQWQPSQAEMVLRAARFAEEPLVRAAAVLALGNVDDPRIALQAGEYLRDSSLEVRRAASEALLWDIERRWNEIREAIRKALADPRLARDNGLQFTGRLSNQAMSDLLAWAGETGPLAHRSVLTIVRHYRRELRDHATEELLRELSTQIVEGRIPTTLRVELAHLLQSLNMLPESVWARLLSPDQPSSLRLLAVETLLRQSSDPRAVEHLREIARSANRGLALASARLVQKHLGVDMGLTLGESLPAPDSKQAADVARRVLRWAAEVKV